MNIAICSATPYQTLNALNFAVNTLTSDDKKDLYYRNFTSQTDAILHMIKKYNIFDNIYEYNLVSKKNKIRYYLNDLIQAIMPKQFLNKLIKSKIKLELKTYNYITMTSGTEFEVALTRIFKQAIIIAYDDGWGSYVGDIIHDHKLNIIWRMLGRRTDQIKPECLYVNNISACRSKLTGDIRLLANLSSANESYKSMISNIFNYSCKNVYDTRKLIYLTQPLKELNICDKSILFEIKETIILNFNKNYIIRKHPRESNEEYYGYNIDNENNLWELVCENEITEQHALIAVCSTTQIMPKLLYNKEPYIIFLYRLFDWSNNTIMYNRFENLMSIMCSTYIHKERIKVPESLEELNDCLKIALLIGVNNGEIQR